VGAVGLWAAAVGAVGFTPGAARALKQFWPVAIARGRHSQRGGLSPIKSGGLHYSSGLTVAVGQAQLPFQIFQFFSNKQNCSDLENTKSILLELQKFPNFARWKNKFKRNNFSFGKKFKFPT
jgi:hypothetical protein